MSRVGRQHHIYPWRTRLALAIIYKVKCYGFNFFTSAHSWKIPLVRLQPRSALAIALGTLVAFAAIVPSASAETASILKVSTETGLREAIVNAVDGDTIQLTGNIGAAAARTPYLHFPKSGTLDLNGHALFTDSLVLGNTGVGTGIDFTITDSSVSKNGILNARHSTAVNTPASATSAITVHRSKLTIAEGNVSADGAATGVGIGAAAYPNSTQGVNITGGTVSATALGNFAAIGATPNEIATGDFYTRISGGKVTAMSASGAAIGNSGGANALGKPTVAISGGTVIASSVYGAGIGGGSRPSAATSTSISDITISGSAVVNTHSVNGAGIGGGHNGSAKEIVIGAGAQVTAFSTNSAAVGAGLYGTADGELSVNGTLTLPAGTLIRAQKDRSKTIGVTGVITGAGALRGAGVWINSGAITLPNDKVVAADINGNHFNVTLQDTKNGAAASQVRVLAPSFAAGDRVLPKLPNASGWTFAGWNTAADGGGTPFTANTAMTAQPEVGGVDGTAITLFAQWKPTTISVTATPNPEPAGDSVSLNAHCYGPAREDLGDCTGLVTFTSSVASDVITDNQATVIHAGSRTFTATVKSDASIAASATTSVARGALDHLKSFPNRAMATAGEAVTFSTNTFDVQGNLIEDVSNKVTLRSDNDGDTITGNTVTFATPGARTITARYGAWSASAKIEVIPTPAVQGTPTSPTSAGGDAISGSTPGSTPLAKTGTNSAPLLGISALLLMFGAGLTANRVRARRRTAENEG